MARVVDLFGNLQVIEEVTERNRTCTGRLVQPKKLLTFSTDQPGADAVDVEFGLVDVEGEGEVELELAGNTCKAMIWPLLSIL
jgi:hypothetical protein